MTSKIGAIFGKDHAQKKSKVLQRSLRAQEDAALQAAACLLLAFSTVVKL
ncbi:hypothetical protein NKI50_05285 [Mesorhizobium sp. M0563]